jgi:plastocyanin
MRCPVARTALLLLALPAIAVTPNSAAAQWGNLKGRVVVAGEIPDVPLLHAKGDAQVKEPICRAHDIADESLLIDSETRGLANVFVFLQRAPKEIHPDLAAAPEEPLVFDQKQCRFTPHAMVVRTGQTVLVKSDDPILHNTHTSPTFNVEQNVAVQPKDREGIPMTFRQREPSPVHVKCDLHPWMVAWWLVVDHPYAAVTDEKGEFTIENLPAGEHRFRVWHERAGWLDRSLSVNVPDGGTEEISIEVPTGELKAK